jgi:predicted N-acetyltransferase YhbS
MRSDYPRHRRDLVQLKALIADSFSPRHADLQDTFHADFTLDPALDRECVRLVRRHGEVVSSVTVYPKEIRIGRARLSMGGLGFVCCKPKYRGSGYASDCVRGCLEVMSEKGITTSFLFGIDRFYRQFGYVGCLPGYRLKTSVNELAKLSNSFEVLNYEKGLLNDMLALYEQAAAHSPASVVRTPAQLAFALRRCRLLSSAPKAAAKDVLIFREKKGRRRVRAYLIWRDGGLVEAGLAPDDEAAAEALLAYMRDRRKEALEKEVVLQNLGPMHPLWRYALRFNHGTEQWFSWSGGGMGRINDVAAFTKALAPEWEARLNAAGVDAEGHLQLRVDGKDHFVILCRGHRLGMTARETRSVKVTCTQQALLQMALG